MNAPTETSKKHFACTDVGYDCTWRLEGDSEEQMLPIIEKHAAEVHNLTHFKEEAVEHVLEAIRKHG
jgi:predicted small metal-binding protein